MHMGYLYTPCMYKLPQPMEFFPNEVFLDVALSELPSVINSALNVYNRRSYNRISKDYNFG